MTYRVIRQRLGQQATEVYVRADPTEKLHALGVVLPPSLRRGLLTVPDRLIAMLHGQ